MTDPADRSAGGDDVPPAPAATPALGLFRFTLEGRTAPGLFGAGWLTSLLGAIGAFVGILAGPTVAGALLFVIGLAALLIGLVLLGGAQAIERRVAGSRYAGPAPLLVLAATGVGLYVAVAVVATPLRAVHVELTGPGLTLFAVLLQALVGVALIRVLVVGSGALSWTDMGLRLSLPGTMRDLAWGATFALPVIVITAMLVGILVNLLHAAPESPLQPTGTGIGLAINLLAGAVIAPVYEELLFRGFATTAWARVVPAATAIIRTSLLFALAHVITQGGDTFDEAIRVVVVGAGARIPVAFALGYVFLRRGSLWAAIGLHATFNAVLIVLAERALTG